MIKQRFLSITLIVCLLFLTISSTANPVIAAHNVAMPSSANLLSCGTNTVSLVSPADKANLPALYTDFSFLPISGITTYVLAVSTQPDFPDLDPNKSERGYEFTIPSLLGGTFTLTSSITQNFLPDTTYYWRVAPKCQGSIGNYSTVFQFKTPKDGILLEAPTLDQPTNEMKAATNGVTFTWEKITGATSYQIRFYRNESDATADKPELAEADGYVHSIHSEYAYVPELPFNSTFYWRVAAVNNYAVGDLSAPRKLTIPVKNGTAQITQDGGFVSSDGGAVTVFVDPNTVLSPTTFTLSLNPHPSTNPPFRFGNRAFSVTATRNSDGSPITQFGPAHRLHFRMTFTDEDLLAAEISKANDLELLYYDGSSWQPSFMCFIYVDEHHLDCDIDHLTEFAIGAPLRIFLPAVFR